jgi:hypothetical protein
MPDKEHFQEVTGALSLGLLAAQFVTEPETWPVFAAWLATKPGGEGLAPLTREYAQSLTAGLADGVILSDMLGGMAGSR